MNKKGIITPHKTFNPKPAGHISSGQGADCQPTPSSGNLDGCITTPYPACPRLPFAANFPTWSQASYILRCDIADAQPEDIPPQTYTGRPLTSLTPVTKVFYQTPNDGTVQIELGRDYDLTFKKKYGRGRRRMYHTRQWRIQRTQNGDFSHCTCDVMSCLNGMKSAYLTIVTLVLMLVFPAGGRAQTCPSLPEAQVAASPAFVYDAGADSMTVTVSVKNVGGATFVSPFKVTVYKDDIGDAKRYTFNYNSAIAAGETKDVTFGIGKFKAEWMPFDALKIRINDSGNGYNDQAVCDSAYRDYTTVQLIASDDRILVFNGSVNNQIRVAINDILPASYISLAVNILDDPAQTSTATVSGSNIFYTPAAGKTADTLRYRIHCGNAAFADTATIYIVIKEKPDNVDDADCFVEPPDMNWGIVLEWSSTETDVYPHVIPLIGDMNNDSIPEIAVFTTEGLTTGHSQQLVKTIAIYDTRTRSRITKFSLPSTVPGYEINTWGMVRKSTDTVLIVVATLDFKIRAYDYSGTLKWTSDTDYGSTNGEFSTTIGFADFNRDGTPELYLNNKIYNADNGHLLATSDGGTNRGAAFGCWSGSTGWKMVANYAADVLETGDLQLIYGNEIYEVKIINTDNPTGNSLTRVKSISPPSGVVADGHTQVADFNRDGHLDVFISNRTTKGAGGTVHGYVWDVYNNTVSSPFAIVTGTYSPGGKSIPLIGDFDGDNIPEVLIQCQLTGSNKPLFRTFKYNPAARTFSQLWDIYPNEDSNSTGASMFDFNIDGKMEVVLQDQIRLRIIDAATGVELTPLTFGAGTAMQYPVVADPYGKHGDGSARLISIGTHNGTATQFGSLHILKASSGKWAPARSVWNQFMYNSVNIGNDLVPPAYPLNPATVFPGADGQLGTSDDVRPYNNFLQQQTTLSKNGTPYVKAADYAIEGVPTATLHLAGDSLVIQFCVRNYGDVQGQSPFYISAYKDARQQGNAVITKSYTDFPAPGQTTCYSVKVESISAINLLYLSINDSGNGKNVNPECDSINGLIIFDIKGIVSAQDDYASIFVCDETYIPILDNDEYAGTTFSIMNIPKYGTAAPSGSLLKYSHAGASGLTCEQTGNRTDTIRYKIESIVSSAEADVIIKIYNTPGMMLEDSCSVNPKIALSNSYDGFTYQWEHSSDGASGWKVLSADNSATKLNITEAGFYRVT
ncbi:MAG: VCBS repeat-containing protein, partial [Tannerella sp.]|nr:VCBS repeat-containing protein [Tannerella sp.]